MSHSLLHTGAENSEKPSVVLDKPGTSLPQLTGSTFPSRPALHLIKRGQKTRHRKAKKYPADITFF